MLGIKIELSPPFVVGETYQRAAIDTYVAGTQGIDPKVVGGGSSGELYVRTVAGQLIARFQCCAQIAAWVCQEVYTPRPFLLGDGWVRIDSEHDHEVIVRFRRGDNWGWPEIRVDTLYDQSAHERSAPPQARISNISTGETSDLARLDEALELLILARRLMRELNEEMRGRYDTWQRELAARLAGGAA